jgi:hypothetical protein
VTCQSLISDLSDVESPSVATARMHLLRRFSGDGPEKLAPHAGGPSPCVCGERLKNGGDFQWVAGIKKTGLRGTPPFLSLSTALIHPTPWFLSSGRGTQARAPARRIFR